MAKNSKKKIIKLLQIQKIDLYLLQRFRVYFSILHCANLVRFLEAKIANNISSRFTLKQNPRGFLAQTSPHLAFSNLLIIKL